MGDFTHLSSSGQAAIVNVEGKKPSARLATVRGQVQLTERGRTSVTPEVSREIISTARIAAVQAAKHTAQLIPLCHQIPLSWADAQIEYQSTSGVFAITMRAAATWTTGVEMEAFCAAQIAGATIYDMVKAVDPEALVGPFFLAEKSGGKHGLWRPRQEPSGAFPSREAKHDSTT